ncbi:MAG TPA: caspase family protein [Acidimicrobiales bacterium]|nr:caspase family protein [Acidimicrobiales bacterium]
MSFVLVVVLTSDQRGLLAVGAAPVDRPTEVPGTTIDAPVRSRALAGGFEALSARLRLENAAVAPPVAAESAAPPATTPPPPPSGGRGARTGDVAIAPPPPAFGGEVAAPPPPPAQLPPSRYDSRTAVGGTWALVIGVNDYPGLRYDLRSAVNDANDMNDALARLGVTADRRLVLRDRQADAGTIRAALDWLTAHAGPGSTIVLFFAGHVQRIESGREALVGSDGGLVPDTEVAAMLDRSPAERAWITIAACYGGGFDEVVRPGRILTAAAPSDRVAYENEGFGRSYLVEYMVRRGILGRGISTVEGAFAWATAELQRDYPDRLPVQLDAVRGDFDLRTGTASPSSSDGPSSSGPTPSSPPPPTTPPDDDCSALTVGVVRCS